MISGASGSAPVNWTNARQPLDPWSSIFPLQCALTYRFLKLTWVSFKSFPLYNWPKRFLQRWWVTSWRGWSWTTTETSSLTVTAAAPAGSSPPPWLSLAVHKSCSWWEIRLDALQSIYLLKQTSYIKQLICSCSSLKALWSKADIDPKDVTGLLYCI